MIITEWKRLKGYGDRRIISQGKSRYSPAIVEYEIPIPSKFGLAGESLLFLSDIHWGNSRLDQSPIIELAREIQPKWIVFGGDLTNYACFVDEAFDALAAAFEPFSSSAKIAVPGNWDRRRKRWFPNSIFSSAFAEIGFHYLVNDTLESDGIVFQGLDDAKNGNPRPMPEKMSIERLNCVVSHNPATIAEFSTKSESAWPSKLPTCLALAGHTHGGQIRLPGFGALLTSTKYWKLFEYGLYENKKTGIRLLVTSGIGTNRLPLRLFCDPEIVLARFTDEN